MDFLRRKVLEIPGDTVVRLIVAIHPHRGGGSDAGALLDLDQTKPRQGYDAQRRVAQRLEQAPRRPDGKAGYRTDL